MKWGRRLFVITRGGQGGWGGGKGGKREMGETFFCEWGKRNGSGWKKGGGGEVRPPINRTSQEGGKKENKSGSKEVGSGSQPRNGSQPRLRGTKKERTFQKKGKRPKRREITEGGVSTISDLGNSKREKGGGFWGEGDEAERGNLEKKNGAVVHLKSLFKEFLPHLGGAKSAEEKRKRKREGQEHFKGDSMKFIKA